MLRQRKFTVTLVVAVLLLSGTVFSQRLKGELTVTKCWHFPLENAIGIASNGKEIFVATLDGRVIAFSGSGEKLWQTDLGGELRATVRTGPDAVIVSTRNAAGGDIMHGLSLSTGVPLEKWTPPVSPADIEASAKIPATATAVGSLGETIAYGDERGVVNSIRPGGSKLWKFKTGGTISAIVPSNGEYIVLSKDNFVYSLSSKSGGLHWKRRVQGRVARYALGDDFLLVAALDQAGASMIDINSGRVVGQIPLDKEDLIVADPVPVDKDFILATTAGVTSYSIGACGKK